jgi:hypothetical protein
VKLVAVRHDLTERVRPRHLGPILGNFISAEIYG